MVTHVHMMCVFVYIPSLEAFLVYVWSLYLFPDKGVDECFSSYNTEGNYFGNCGSDGTNFIGCSTRYEDKHCNYIYTIVNKMQPDFNY